MSRRCGRIKVFAGPMFSRKTSEMVIDIERAVLGKKFFIAIKPRVDTRVGRSLDEKLGEVLKPYGIDISSRIFYVSTQDEFRFRTTAEGIDLLAIDEAQFFEYSWIVEEVEFAARSSGIDVVIAGLDLDYMRKGFGYMPQLLAIADEAHKPTAICSNCGSPARFTQRIAGADGRILVDTGKEYEARCGDCYFVYKAS